MAGSRAGTATPLPAWIQDGRQGIGTRSAAQEAPAAQQGQQQQLHARQSATAAPEGGKAAAKKSLPVPDVCEDFDTKVCTA